MHRCAPADSADSTKRGLEMSDQDVSREEIVVQFVRECEENHLEDAEERDEAWMQLREDMGHPRPCPPPQGPRAIGFHLHTEHPAFEIPYHLDDVVKLSLEGMPRLKAICRVIGFPWCEAWESPDFDWRTFSREALWAHCSGKKVVVTLADCAVGMSVVYGVRWPLVGEYVRAAADDEPLGLIGRPDLEGFTVMEGKFPRP